jgi:hypothetical protein
MAVITKRKVSAAMRGRIKNLMSLPETVNPNVWRTQWVGEPDELEPGWVVRKRQQQGKGKKLFEGRLMDCMAVRGNRRDVLLFKEVT